MIIKTLEEIDAMKAGGKIARDAVIQTIRAAAPGMTTMNLNDLAEQHILSAGGKPCFKGFEGFPSATCINVNEGIVHGLPGSYKLKTGDLVSLDLGVLYKGMITDVSESFEVKSAKHKDFLNAGKNALKKAIEECVVGNHIGDISYAMQKTIETAGYSVSRDLAGHGVGKMIHEDPYVPCYGRPKRGIKVVEGMTLAIEVIYQKGFPELILDPDGWTLSTRDGSLSGLFESSVAVLKQGVLVLT